MMKKDVLQAPAAWINSRHAEVQREMELDRRIAYAHATDYDEPADIDFPEIAIGAIAAYLTLGAMIIALT